MAAASNGGEALPAPAVDEVDEDDCAAKPCFKPLGMYSAVPKFT